MISVFWAKFGYSQYIGTRVIFGFLTRYLQKSSQVTPQYIVHPNN
jgi:hypothetical protein